MRNRAAYNEKPFVILKAQLMIRSVFLAVACLAAFGCASSLNTVKRSVGEVMPTGYKALSLPRRSIPVGALWRQGIGPEGNGVAAEYRESTQSISRLNVDQQFSADLKVSIINYLNLGPAFTNSLNVDISNLVIDRVVSLDELKGSSGQEFLYEGLRAKDIKVSYSSQLDSAFKISAQSKGIPIILDGATNGQNNVTLDGSDLFIGYRVVRLEQGRVERRSKKLNFEGEATVEPYQVNLDYRELASCMCNREPGRRASQCLAQTPTYVNVVNYSRLTTSGGPFQRRFTLDGREQWPYQVPLGSEFSGSSIIFDTLVVGPIYVPTVSDVLENQLFCLTGVEDGSEVELVRSTLEIISVANPRAPGY
ncbi:MAG: hypothetical protein V4628_08300 [Pseudomonadota bacterium]